LPAFLRIRCFYLNKTGISPCIAAFFAQFSVKLAKAGFVVSTGARLTQVRSSQGNKKKSILFNIFAAAS
jgi:hypothetical protein